MRSSDVRPCLSGQQQTDGAAADVISAGQGFLADTAGCILSADLSDRHIGQARTAAALPSRYALRLCPATVTLTASDDFEHQSTLSFSPKDAPALDGLSRVTSVRVRHQVRWPDAPKSTAVTQMGDMWCFGRWFVSGQDDVGGDVCPDLLVFEAEAPIAVTASRSGPDPALSEFWAQDRTVLVDFRPKAIRPRPRFSLGQPSALRGAIGEASTLHGCRTSGAQLDRLNTHPEPPTRGAMPSAVTAARGLLHVNFTTPIRVMGVRRAS